ncbi:hypothetical protein TSUD_56170 [Trifolium subterraneum]|uniref:Protein kinase domain-containing protein n=1 Tax=Trifolium subterraneum TaxID=3900 RepID=A0A2Z6N4E1_TRISU|nr:hypothetical protein TSUD_56170 [Trifolium subterraneum]
MTAATHIARTIVGIIGLATHFQPSQGQLLTRRVVPAPLELLLRATNYGVVVDLWSAACILAELLAGKPKMPERTEEVEFASRQEIVK